MKKCKVCEKMKPFEEFVKAKRNKDGYAGDCKECRNEYKKRKYHEDGHTKLTDKKRHMRKTYGISYEDYREMFDLLEGKCESCGKQCNDRILSEENILVIDYCHKTGDVRGLLCHECNLLLGNAKDNIDILRGAIKYLRKNQNT